jgi:hypothetical protein
MNFLFAFTFQPKSIYYDDKFFRQNENFISAVKFLAVLLPQKIEEKSPLFKFINFAHKLMNLTNSFFIAAGINQTTTEVSAESIFKAIKQIDFHSNKDNQFLWNCLISAFILMIFSNQ